MPSICPDISECKNYRNLVGYVVGKPPCVVFVIFIGTFALAFLSLGYYVQHKALVDEEASEEWNDLYSSLLSLSYCLQNGSIFYNLTHMPIQNSHEYVNVSLPYTFTIFPKQEQVTINTTLLISSIPYFFLNLKDIHAPKVYIWINVSSAVPYGPCIKSNPRNVVCDVLPMESCVTLMLPKVAMGNKSPPRVCNASSSSFASTRQFSAVMTGKDGLSVRRSFCGNDIPFSLKRHASYKSDVFLSLEERSKVNLRLQIASYILFVILLSFVLYAIIKGKPIKPSFKKVFLS